MVARVVRVDEVTGSNPVTPTIHATFLTLTMYGVKCKMEHAIKEKYTVERHGIEHRLTAGDQDVAYWSCMCGLTGWGRSVTDSYRAAALHMEATNPAQQGSVLPSVPEPGFTARQRDLIPA